MNTLETHVLELVGENTASPDVFVDTASGIEQIRDSLNDAIEEIAMVTGGYKSTYHLPLRANAHFYNLRFTADHFGWITDAWLLGTHRRLEHTSLISMNTSYPRWLENTGTPEKFGQIGDENIFIWPVPSSNSSLIRLDMVMIPARYESGTARIKLRDEFSWAAVNYAVADFWASRGDARTAGEYLAKYLSSLDKARLFPKASERTYQSFTDKRLNEHGLAGTA